VYHDPAYLIRLWKWLKEYFDRNQRHATNREVVQAGFASSTSVVRYYYNAMVEYQMLKLDHGIARGIRLLLLEHAHPAVQEILNPTLRYQVK
jgi:hypothetical protein